jgi:hypothetical protein
MLVVCKRCYERLFENPLNPQREKGMDHLCELCTDWSEVIHIHNPKALKKRKGKRIPKKAKDCLKRIRIVTPITVGDSVEFSGSIESVIENLKYFRRRAAEAGYDHIHFQEDGDYESTWSTPWGVRMEKNGEMNRRFAGIRKKRQRALDRKQREQDAVRRNSRKSISCCVSDQFCEAPSNQDPLKAAKCSCYRCGGRCCNKCSDKRYYKPLQSSAGVTVRLCHTCQEEYDGNDKKIIEKLRRLAR